MTHAELVHCVEAGLGHRPTNDEISEWLYGAGRKKLTEAEQLRLLQTALSGSPNDWQLKVLALIQQIPAGRLITYGELARWANREFNLNIIPRNTARLREKVYKVVGHDTEIPLHRIAKKGDIRSECDHPITQHINRHKRGAEGSFNHPVWFHS